MRKIKNACRAVGAAWWLEVRSVLFSSRWLVVTLLSLFLLRFYLSDVLRMAQDYDLTVNPIVLPFLFSDSCFGNLGLMVLVFLMGVFPFRDNLQRGIRMKTGNKLYGVAQILTMITLALLWVVELELLSVLLINTRCGFGSWGKVWGTFSSGRSIELGYDTQADINMNIILNYKPYQALLVGMLFTLLVSIIFAELIFFADAVTETSVGEIILAVYCFGFFALASLNVMSITQMIAKFNPVSWMNISNYMTDTGAFREALLQIAGMLLVLTIADYEVIRHKIIEEARD